MGIVPQIKNSVQSTKILIIIILKKNIKFVGEIEYRTVDTSDSEEVEANDLSSAKESVCFLSLSVPAD